MSESLGARLRQRREERQIDLIAIAEQTKIKLGLLEALERDDVSHWPSGIFRRAYVRTYAQFLSLDPDLVLREFLEVHPDPDDLFPALATVVDDQSRRSSGPPTRLRTIVDSAIGSLARLRRPAAGDQPAPAGATAPVLFSGPPVADLAPAPAMLMRETDGETPAAPVSDPWLDRIPDAPAPVFVFDEQLPPAAADVEIETVPAIEASEPAAALPSMPEAAVDEPRSGGLDNGTGRVHPDVRAVVDVDAAVREVQAANDATLEAAAHLATAFGRAADRAEVQRLLHDSAAALNATGLIAWLWDEIAQGLRPALVHGYSEKVLAHVPAVERDADNATAAAFRSEETCLVSPTAHHCGALVVPLFLPDGCVGVLAIELQHGVRPTRSLRAVATLLAAALAQLVHRAQPARVEPPIERTVPALTSSRPSGRPVIVRH